MTRKRRYRPKLDSPEPIDGVLDRAGDSRFSPHTAPLRERVWRDAVGGRIADRARPVTLDRGVLTVRVASSAWANELSLLAETIVARLRDERVNVTSLRFRVGTVEAPPRPPERTIPRIVAPPAPLPLTLTRALRTVADEELREVMALAARASLGVQAHHEAQERAARIPRASVAARVPPAKRDGRDGGDREK